MIRKEGCPECGSKNNVAVWEDGGKHCFSPGCTYHVHSDQSSTEASNYVKPKRALEMNGVVAAIDSRRLSVKTCRKFGVTVEYDTAGKISYTNFPYCNIETGKPTAAKRKDVNDKGNQRWSGNREGIGLFGQQTCSGRGKYITITEGEEDALAVSEMFDNRWDVVSIKDGAGSAARDIKANLEFLEGYDNVILCFDNDDAGHKATNESKELFSPNKCKIVTLPRKDAGEMLENRETKAFTSSWWDAKVYAPDGIVPISETWDAILKYRDTPSTPYPWDFLNEYLLGQRMQEIVIWAADTGIGKSQAMREIQSHLIETTDARVGCLMLEESIAKTTLGWMSFAAGRPLHKELDKVTEEELKGYWDQVTKGDRYVLLDHKGWQNNIDTLKARIRYMAKALDCKYIVLDHLHIALSSVAGASGDWSGIDELMTEFRSLVHELDICLHLVSHTSGDRNLRGSKGIGKLADAVIFLERDKHHENPEMANITSVVVDKNRFVGDVGTAGYLRYDKFTGRMTPCAAPEDFSSEDAF